MASTTTTPKNLYHRRLVAESSAKACWICYKPSSTVLITPEQDDWFHLCPGHLTDSKFAIARDAEDVAKRQREDEIQKEIDVLKKEFEERVAKKLEKRNKKKGSDEKEKEAKEAKKQEEEDAKEEKEKEEKLKALEKKKSETEKVTVAGPRIFELQKQFFQMRLQRKRDAEQARRNLERLRSPGAFPSVPSGIP